MRPFLSYYGGKWSTALRYPSPRYGSVIEPFAGGAGYSVRHKVQVAHLYDVNPLVVAVWDYLIRATPSEIRGLPLLVPGQSVDELRVCPEARLLIGWWVNKGVPTPHKTLSAWAREERYASQFWGVKIRERIATQVSYIKDWKVEQRSYQDIPQQKTTWFVDPPYSNSAGSRYPFSDIDYQHLAEWCKSITGQVIVCEQKGADWLPFVYLGNSHTTADRRSGAVKTAPEVMWSNH